MYIYIEEAQAPVGHVVSNCVAVHVASRPPREGMVRTHFAVDQRLTVTHFEDGPGRGLDRENGSK